jgi:hypothetical protein
MPDLTPPELIYSNQPVRWRVAVCRIPHHKNPVGLHPRGMDVVDRPIADLGHLDPDIRVADLAEMIVLA